MMKLTKGKLAFYLIILMAVINDVFYFIKEGNPFSGYMVDFWGLFTGTTIIFVVVVVMYAIIQYIIDNWKEPLFKNHEI